MSYKVRLTIAAELSLYKAAKWWADNRDAAQAIAWLEGFETAINNLAESPERHAVDREDPAFPYTLRQLPYGVGKKRTHRALFQVCGDEVVVHLIRHLSQRDVTPKDLGYRGL